MIARAGSRLARLSRAGIVLVVAGLLYCVAVETWLPRNDEPPAIAPPLVIALSAGVRLDGTLNEAGAARLRTAIAFAVSRGARLVTTRVQRRDAPHLTSDPGQRQMIASAGLSDRWTTLDGFALTTRHEAELLTRIAPPGRIAVVTSRLHTRRACATFEHLGYQVTCISSGRDGPWWRIPYGVAYESAAFIKYRLKGWI